jgi:hypothetical protein
MHFGEIKFHADIKPSNLHSLIHAAAHHHCEAGFARSLRGGFVHHAFLQPDGRALYPQAGLYGLRRATTWLGRSGFGNSPTAAMARSFVRSSRISAGLGVHEHKFNSNK